MVTVEDVAALIRQEARRKLPADTVLEESTVLGDLGLSSLQIAEIVFGLEETHEIAFDESRAADVKTLGDLVALTNQALAESDQAEPVRAKVG